MQEFPFKINKEIWTIYLYSQEEYVYMVDSDSEAETDTNQKSISFYRDRITKETLEHELTHAYFDNLCLRSCDSFELRQMEEIIAEFIPKYGQKIINTAKKLQKAIDKAPKEE